MLGLLKQLHIISSWYKKTASQDQKESALEFAKKILAINPSKRTSFVLTSLGVVLSDPAGAEFVVSLLLSFLDRGVSLSFKNEALDLLPFVLVFSDEKLSKRVLKSLGNMISYDFPMTSTDLPQESTVYDSSSLLVLTESSDMQNT